MKLFSLEGQQTSGRGDTGAVQKVSLVHRRDQVVTIMKTCEIGSKTSLKSLLSELKVMLYLGRHENLVNFIGAYTQELSKGKVITTKIFFPLEEYVHWKVNCHHFACKVWHTYLWNIVRMALSSHI